MKIIKLLCVLLLVLFPSSSLFSQSLICTLMGMRCPVKMEDLLERKGLYYKPFSEKPFTGKVSGLQRGKISIEKRYWAAGVYPSNVYTIMVEKLIEDYEQYPFKKSVL